MIYLHIGAGKTGTTSLQAFLSQFRTEIQAQGYHILDAGSDQGSAAHHQLATGFGFTIKNNDDYCEQIFDALRQEVDAHKNRKMIISSENFHSHVTDVKLQNLSRALSHPQVKVILYVRRQEEWIDSAFRQFSQMGNTFSVEQIIEKALKNRLIDYKWQVDMWGKYFGLENVIVRVYESGEHKRDTVADFTEVIGIEMSAQMKQFEFATNPSVSPAEAEIQRIVNCVSSEREIINNELMKVLASDKSIDNSKYHFMTEQIRHRLRSFFSEGNDYLATEYFGRKAGGLFIDPPKC